MQSQAKSVNNRSLERGIAILRCFRPGVSALSNIEIAERTSLAKSTVSRLTATLVRDGMLRPDYETQGYRIGPLALSLASVVLHGSPAAKVIRPLMADASARLKANIAFATPDREDMVCYHAACSPEAGFIRQIETGSLIPMRTSALGRAYLATLKRQDLHHFLTQTPDESATALRAEILDAIQSVREVGYCTATPKAGVFSIAAPVESYLEFPYCLGVYLPAIRMQHRGYSNMLVGELRCLIQAIQGQLER